MLFHEKGKMAMAIQARAQLKAHAPGDPRQYKIELENDGAAALRINKARYAIRLAAVILALSSAITARVDDQQLVADFLDNLNVHGYMIRPITDVYVGRTFPNFSFFGVIFPQYPVARLCPGQQGLECSNIFFVQDEAVGFVPNISELKTFFSQQLSSVPSEDAANNAGRSWLRFSDELKQDLFFVFSSPAVEYTPKADGTTVTGQVVVTTGGQGEIDMTMNFSVWGTFVDVRESSTVRPGVRPICQATKLLDRDPVVRRMAEQDILVMGRMAKPYLDEIRAKAKPKLKQAIDGIWRRIVDEGR
jgi:hypothetical protein